MFCHRYLLFLLSKDVQQPLFVIPGIHIVGLFLFMMGIACISHLKRYPMLGTLLQGVLEKLCKRQQEERLQLGLNRTPQNLLELSTKTKSSETSSIHFPPNRQKMVSKISTPFNINYPTIRLSLSIDMTLSKSFCRHKLS